MQQVDVYMHVVYHYNPTSNRNGNSLYGSNGTVVYHYNPTSNRNSQGVKTGALIVVYHYNPTSNRNFSCLRVDI